MTSPNREKEIFERALDIESTEERAVFVRRACGGDEALTQRVFALLKASETAPDFLPDNSVQNSAATVSAPFVEGPGSTIGRYKLLEQIGEGGFGYVYMAEQLEPVKRRVALKIIKPGMDSKQVIGRFEAERQALALMDHPNIAKIYDAGTTTPSETGSSGRESAHTSSGESQSRLTSAATIGVGRPYFVMELVKGIPITKFCEEQQLDLEARLNLFIQVCSAVQHAHQKGIIHRDLKPSNILVTLHGDQPVPKVIDFGIAKATQQPLTDKTVFTQFQQFIGTPAYMSPEQATLSGLDVDTRSDIYSLGVLLYELLTGSPPFDTKELLSAGLDEMRRIIREKEPMRPSTKLSRMLVGADVRRLKSEKLAAEGVRASSRRLLQGVKEDLDWIVMKALEKDRARRYETANGLAADLKRYLSHEPVTAVAPTLVYQLTKFYQRNRKFARLAGAFGALLLLATLFSTWQAYRATQAEAEQTRLREEADRDRQEADSQRLRAEENERQANENKEAALESEQTMRERLYAADMVAVQQAMRDDNLGQARELLAQYVPEAGSPDLRGWEWRYYWNLTKGDQIHTFSVSASTIAFSPDGTQLITGNGQGMLFLWEVQEHTLSSSFSADTSEIVSLAFNHSGNLLAVGSQSSVSLWPWPAPETPRPIARRSIRNGYARVAFLPGTAGVVIGHGSGFRGYNGGSVEIWDYEKDQVVRTLNEAGGRIALTADGRTLFTGQWNDTIRRWDLSSGSVTAQGDFSSALGLWDIGCSPDGRWVITTGAEDDERIKLWNGHDLSLARILKDYPSKTDTYSLALSSDNRLAATGGSDQLIHVWTLDGTSPPIVLRGHGSGVTSLAFSPTGSLLASAGWPGADDTVRLWDIRSNATRKTISPVANVSWGPLPAFSRDGKLLALSAPGFAAVEIWDLDSMRRLQVLHETALPLGFSTDGQRLLTSDVQLQVKSWDWSTGRMISTMPLSSLDARHNPAVLSPNAGYLLAGTRSGELMLWDLSSGEQLLSVRINGIVRGLSFSPDGSLFAAAGDRVARVWKLRTLRMVASLAGHGNDIYGTAFSQDGKRLATASIDGTLKVWDVAGQSERMTLRGHKRGVGTVCFGKDGRSVMSASGDGTVRFWNLTTGREVGRWQSTFAPRIVLSPDDTKLIASDRQGLSVLRAPFLEAQSLPANSASGPGTQSFVDLSNPDVASRIFNSDSVLKQRLAQWAPDDTIGSMQLAFALAWTDQTNEHEAFCKRVLDHAAKTEEASTLDRAAKSYLVGLCSDPGLLKQAVALAEQAWELGKDGEYLPWFQMCLGLARYRENDYPGALEVLAEPATASEPWIKGPSLMIQAMALHHLNRLAEARSSLDAGEQLMGIPPQAGEVNDAVLTNHDGVFFWLLHAEAKALIEGTPASK